MSPSSEMVPVRDKIPYNGKGTESLLLALRKILTEHPYTQEFRCSIGQPIEILSLVPADMVPAKTNLHDAIRNVRMEEFVNDKLTPFQTLWAMYGIVQAEGLTVSHISVGDKFHFQKWLDIRIPHNRLSFFGTPVVHMPEMPPDVFLVVGSNRFDADPEDVKFSVKATIL